MQQEVIRVGLVDDHTLLRAGLAGMINNFPGYKVVLEASDGEDCISKLGRDEIPALILLDINMPGKDGYETARWLRGNYPQMLVLALSMYDSEPAIIKMLRSGARGYLLKDTDPSEFRAALDSVVTRGFHYSELVTGRLIHAINNINDEAGLHKGNSKLNEREISFLKLACTEMTYKEIADQMNLSPRTIDGYRDTLFEKLNIKTRVGLAMYAIRNRLVMI